jgi:hypothetical protein
MVSGSSSFKRANVLAQIVAGAKRCWLIMAAFADVFLTTFWWNHVDTYTVIAGMIIVNGRATR